MPTRADLLNEMNGLMRLTAIEADVARSRATQARDESIRGELLDNARHADVRRLALHREVASLGGVPDILGVALDRIVTVARTQVLDQAMPITEALMADLVLEHQLRDRAAFARVIADSLEERRSVETLEKVEAAHVAAIEWIETRLGEVALGGPAALRPTPLQATAAVGQRVATMPSRVMVAGINRGIAVAERLGGRVGDRVGRAREVTEAAEGAFEEAFAAGRDTLLRTAESESESRGERRAATALHRVRAESGALSAEELPIRRFETLTAAQAITRIERLDDAGEVRAVRSFEAEHKNRSSVLRAADRRVTELAGEAMS